MQFRSSVMHKLHNISTKLRYKCYQIGPWPVIRILTPVTKSSADQHAGT